MEKIMLNIAGEQYAVRADEDLDYVAALGEELSKKIGALLEKNNRLTASRAAVLTALDCLDELKKAQRDIENLRSQLRDYLEQAAKAATDAAVSKKEAERLAKEVTRLKAKHEKD